MKTLLLSALLLCVVGFTACIKKAGVPSVDSPTASRATTPEGVVRQFVEFSAGATGETDRTKLQDLCSGEMRRAFERMSPEAFKIAYLNNTVKVKDVKIVETKTEGDSAIVIYEVSIENAQGTDTTNESSRRRVELTKSQGNWLVDSIRPEGSDKIAFTRGMIF
jgi:hypothetical protein